MDQTRHPRLEMPVAEPELNVSSLVSIVSEAKKRGLSEIPIAGTCKVVLKIRSWPESMDTPVDPNYLKEKFIPNFERIVKNLEYDYSQDCLPVDVDVSPTKSTRTRRTRRKRRPGPISIVDDSGSDDSGSDESSGSDVLNQEEEDPVVEFPPGVTDDIEGRNILLRALSDELKFRESVFKRQYSYGTSADGSTTDPSTLTMDVRHCITSDNAFSWKEESTGIMWIGVYGMNDICVVTLSELADRTRVKGCLASFSDKTVLSMFRKCVLKELEELADPSSQRCEKLRRSFDLPFCVVSAAPGTAETPDESGHETSSALCAARAINTFSHLAKQRPCTNTRETILCAISAFLSLLGTYCAPDKMEVTLVSNRRYGEYPTIEDLETSEIGEYLKIVEAEFGKCWEVANVEKVMV